MRQDYQEFTGLDTEIIVIGSEKADIFKAYWFKEDLPFIGLPDPEHFIQDLYGQVVNLFKLGRLPAQALVDLSGMTRYLHYGDSMMDIPPNKEILAIIKRML